VGVAAGFWAVAFVKGLRGRLQHLLFSLRQAKNAECVNPLRKEDAKMLAFIV
jgi:hypothetical protein